MSEIALQRIREAKEKQLTTLDLSDCGLTEIPGEVGEMVWLEALKLSKNQISNIKPLEGLINLQTLGLFQNQISDIKPLVGLVNLQDLGLSQNQISDIKPLEGLISLHKLRLFQNQISNIKPLEGLINLRVLWFGQNQINDITPLEGLVNLQDLGLSQNQISNIKSLEGLINLQKLRLFQNQISDIKPLEGLINLRILWFGQNQISDITALEGLINLYELRLEYNQINNVTPLAGLTNLYELRLDQNKINNIKPLEGLIKLHSLRFEQNQISDIKPLEGLINLRLLVLYQNQISDIKPLEGLINLYELLLDQNQIPSLSKIEFLTDKSKFKKLQYLSLFGNPMNGIDEKILGTKQSDNILKPLRQYLSQYKKGKKRLFEAKLILVGEGGVGKTSLKQKLKFNQYQAKPGAIPSTEGILSEPWDLKGVSIPGQPKSQQVCLNIWDFGGQEIDHQTHQFFLTKSSVYLFVSNSRLGDTQSKFDYWLNIISKLAPDSPVLVVRNLFDNQKEPFRFEEWRQKYAGQINPKSVTVACTQRDDKGIDQVLDFIRKSLPELENFGVEWPLSYVEIRHELEALALNELNYIPFDQYADICSRHGLETDEEAETLAAYLHNIGTILHYQDDPVLRELVILNPQWLTGAFYKIIRDEGVNREKGLFTRSMLKEIWDRKLYPSDKYPQLIELMMKFELCFPLEQRNHYIIPQLLQEAENKEARKAISGQDTLRFQYHYDDVLPAGMISRFICKQHGNIAKDAEGNFLYWRYGVLIQREETLALIEQPIGDTKILVTVQGKHKRELLAVIRDCFDQLHRPLNNLKPVEILPCNCEVCAKSKDPHPFKYEVIKRRLNDQDDLFERCDISDAKVNRRTLYADAIDETYVDKERIKALIASGQIDKVMQDYGTDHRFFDMKMRYGILSNEHFIGTLTTDEYLARKTQVAQGLLENLDRND